MGIFKKTRKNCHGVPIPLFHGMTGKTALDYELPDTLKKYYYRRFPNKKSIFRQDVENFISSGRIDIYNIKWCMNNRLKYICLQAVNELEEQHIKRRNTINIIIANKQAHIRNLDIQIQELEKTIQLQESEIS